MKPKILILFISCSFLTHQSARTQVKLSSIFTDNMVLQQKTDAPVWGMAKPDAVIKISTSWDNAVYKTQSDNSGKWKTVIKTPEAGGPYTITFCDAKETKLNNVMIGDVWLCSGQSNMEMPLAGWKHLPERVRNYEQEIASADFPQIRLFHIARSEKAEPADDPEHTEGWQVCSPGTIGRFSSTAYFFGRNLYQHLNMPIGLIHASYGGSSAEAWVSSGSLVHFPYLVQNSNPAQSPSMLFNAMIHPLIPFAFQGVIWYQGETNVGRADQYRELCALLIRDWRQQWKRNFPFYFVQLANYKAKKDDPHASDLAKLREAQMQTLHVENTAMAVAIDLGDEKCIHPANKQEVGRRLSLIALAKVYGKDCIYSGPVFTNYRIEGNKIRICFEDSEQILRTNDGSFLQGFSIAGADRVFHWAVAVIEGNEVIVGSSKVAAPVAVRYAWADNPECNLYNSAGLPASPFRTDDWK
jgi:sialate O-acetylesterase